MSIDTLDTLTQKWAKLPNRLSVSYGRLPKSKDKRFTLEDAAEISINIVYEARKYDVKIEVSNPPIVRFVKYITFLSRKYKDGSCLPTNEDYNNIVIGAVKAIQKIDSKAPYLSIFGTPPDYVSSKAPDISKPFKLLSDRDVLLNQGVLNALDFMRCLTDQGGLLEPNYEDIVRDVLQFRKRLPDGRYEVNLLRFDEYGKLEPVEEKIIIPGEGWIRTIGDYGYPFETQKEKCAVENIEGLKKEVYGYFYMFPPKKRPEMYMGLVTHDPSEGLTNSGLLHMRVLWNAFERKDKNISALRIKHPEIY